MMKRSIVLLLLAVGLIMTGCSNKEETKEPVPKDTTPPKEEIVKEPEFTSAYPLTGIGTNDNTDQRAIAVMVNNHTQARPQSGLSQADIVYELLAEAEITRFLAVFQSDMPERVGPIRSARDYYVELAKGLNSIYIAHGYSPEAQQMLASGYVDNLNGQQYDGTLFKRSSERRAPHNSYISYESIAEGANRKGYDLKGAPTSFTFLNELEVKDLQGESATEVSINYGANAYNVKFEYDGEKYIRHSNGEQTVDAETSKPVAVDNVFIIETTHKVVDNKGRRDIDLKSGGKGYLLQKGKVNKIEWANKGGHIVPVLNGNDVGLVPGKTWVNIIPNQPGLTEKVILNAAGK